MLFFKSKNKVNLGDFCTEYYDTNFLEPIVAGINLSDSYNEFFFEKIAETDDSFRKMSLIKFSAENLIIKFQLFALAWFHQFGDKIAIANSFFTYKYLQNKTREDIWDDSLSYNQVISKSATYGCDPDTMSGRARLSFVNVTKVELFKKYANEGLDTKCVARVLNRYGTESSWNRLSVTLGFLAANLCERLDCDLNAEARFILIAELKGIYDGIKQKLESIKIIAE